MLLSRTQQILRAVHELLRRIDRWMPLSVRVPQVPADVCQGIEDARAVCDAGRVPDVCRDVAIVAVPRLAEELGSYLRHEPGKVRAENGAPGPAFWAAMKALARALHGIEPPSAAPLESVADLLGQGVSGDQIARTIYGRRGSGPFVTSTGAVDTGLLDREARQPGSVIPHGWIPPWEAARSTQRRRELERRLLSYGQRERAVESDCHATVDDLLRRGASVQQIERMKGATREEILERARHLRVIPADAPGYQAARGLAMADADDDEERTAVVADRRAVRALAIELFVAAEGQLTFAEIATQLRQRGHEITTASVATTIAHWKRRMAASSREDTACGS